MYHFLIMWCNVFTFFLAFKIGNVSSTQLFPVLQPTMTVNQMLRDLICLSLVASGKEARSCGNKVIKDSQWHFKMNAQEKEPCHQLAYAEDASGRDNA